MVIAFLIALVASGAISLLLMSGYALYLGMYRGCSVFAENAVAVGNCEPNAIFGGALFVVAVLVFFGVLRETIEVHKRRLLQRGEISK